jgi:PAS domain S-box-containing protein
VTLPLRILYLEDDPGDGELVQATLEGEGIACHITRVETRADFVAALEQGGIDLILADYTLPAFDGMSALKISNTMCPEIPFIFVSGTLGEEVAIEALKMGATDYVFKTRLARILPSVRRALREAGEKTQRKRAEDALRQSERRLRDVIETIPTMAWTATPEGANDFANRGWLEYTGISPSDTLGTGWKTAFHPSDVAAHVQKWQASLATGEPFESEARVRRAANGEYRWFLHRAVPLRGEGDEIVKWYGTATDIEDRKRAEQTLRRGLPRGGPAPQPYRQLGMERRNPPAFLVGGNVSHSGGRFKGDSHQRAFRPAGSS